MNKYSLLLFVTLCTVSYSTFAKKLTIESPAFQLNSIIPMTYTCDGDNISPPLIWHNIPPKTQSLALTVEDPNAVNGTWVHWVLFNIPPTITQLEAGSTVPESATVGKNSWGSLDYRGPCPPSGAHSYIFKLYALDNRLSMGSNVSEDAVLQEMTGHVIDSASWTGIYQK